GKLRPIAVLAETRLAEYPHIPTLAQAGYPGVGTLHWQSMLAPANTPKEVLAILFKAIRRAAGAPPLAEALKQQTVIPKPDARVDGEVAGWGEAGGEGKIELADERGAMAALRRTAREGRSADDAGPSRQRS